MFERFWRQHPALLYGLGLFLGYHLAFNRDWVLLIPAAALTLPLVYARSWGRVALLLLLMVGVQFQVQTPDIPEEGLVGEGHFVISSITNKKTHFGSQWVYNGLMRSFGKERNIPCSIRLPNGKKFSRPPANQSYLVRGRLKANEHGGFYFIIDKKAPWKPVKGSWGIAELRYTFKKGVDEYIKNGISDPQAATFLSGLATGNFDDPVMKFEFSRFGLQHIMAISGFHFAIIAAILSTLLRVVIPQKIANILLIFLLSSYFLFLGESPSIIRAWIMIVVVLIGLIISKNSSGLNSLGVAMIAILLYNPHLSEGLGFYFSFLTTGGILLFYPIFDSVLPRRRLSQLMHMDQLDQHGYLILAIFRQAFALALAVNIVAIPLMLFYFQKFPLLSLVYNLFFPFLVSISMLLLLLGPLFHTINSIYTSFILNFVYNMPSSIHPTIHVTPFSPALLVTYLTMLFLWGVYLKRQLELKREELQDLQLV